jgi:hypothetical protein
MSWLKLMIESKVMIKRIVAMAFVLLAIALSTFNSVNASSMYLDSFSQYQFDQHSEIGNNSCLDVEGGELCNTSDVKSHHDHSDCSDLHCSGFSFPVPDSVFNAESASSALVKSKVNFYISATLSSPYMPPITSL